MEIERKDSSNFCCGLTKQEFFIASKKMKISEEVCMTTLMVDE